MKQHAFGFEQYSLWEAYNAAKLFSRKNVKPGDETSVDQAVNVISSHDVYKMKRTDNWSLKLNARIASHGKQDYLKELLTKYCPICSPAGMRIKESITSFFCWKLYKADVIMVFIQIGAGNIDVFVRHAWRNRMTGSHLWLLWMTSHRLENANGRRQNQSDY